MEKKQINIGVSLIWIGQRFIGEKKERCGAVGAWDCCFPFIKYKDVAMNKLLETRKRPAANLCIPLALLLTVKLFAI
jgi:hypothetical protein